MEIVSLSERRQIYHDSKEKDCSPMIDSCRCPPEAGNAVCDLPSQSVPRPARAVRACRACGKVGKPVQTQTVKAMLSVTLRRIENTTYLFCPTESCPVVY